MRTKTEEETLNNVLDMIANYSKQNFSKWRINDTDTLENEKFLESLSKEYSSLYCLTRNSLKEYLRPICSGNPSLAYMAKEMLLTTEYNNEMELFLDIIENYLIPFNKYLAQSSRGDVEHHIENYYPYITMNTVNFVTNIKGLLTEKFKDVDPKTIKFVDVGCGIGDKVLLANFVFDLNSVGIEYNPHYYEIAKFNESNTKTKNVKFICEDAFNVDFKEFDFVYMYCPIADGDLMGKLNKHIWKTMKKGGLLYDIGSHYNNGFNRLSPKKKQILKAYNPFYVK
jgi:hypothetical protein